MAKTKAQKQEMLNEYKQKLQNATGVIVVKPEGITPNQANEFKQKLHSLDGSSLNVVKNTIFALALKEAGMPELETLQAGSHAVLFVTEDIAGAAKELKQFMKDNPDKVQISSAILDGQVLEANQVEQLADMPSKEQSVAMIAGILTQAMGGVVNVLEDSVRSVAIILDMAFSDEKSA